MTGNNNNDNLNWEYYEVCKFYDGFGNELESATCEYCNKTQPVLLFETEDGVPSPFPNAHRKVMMKQVKIKDRIQYVCLGNLSYLYQTV
jgi:hypothetical protein